MRRGREKSFYTSRPLAFAGMISLYLGPQAPHSPICSSDIHFWKAGRIGSLVVEGDCILGHEASGVVLQCGEGVTSLKPGILFPILLIFMSQLY
jgi:hypothetical protein